ncbi:MAG: nucleotidyltransferase domain-containing protein [Candidatus Omnitrophota bacterium]|jgi:predicted nucleotidyltransferase|nr:MAG: nucleotidyltransferase domain-containing protein [Candidatus Omnitrophota bacterium]
MGKKSVADILSRFQRILEVKDIKPIKVFLYGSYAKGNYTDTSDIDAITVSDDFADKSYRERIKSVSDAIHEIVPPFEAIALTSYEWEIGDSFICDNAGDETLCAAWQMRR